MTGAGRRSLLYASFGGLFFSALGRVFVVRSQTALTPLGDSLDCRRGRLVVSVFALQECNPLSPEGAHLVQLQPPLRGIGYAHRQRRRVFPRGVPDTEGRSGV